MSFIVEKFDLDNDAWDVAIFHRRTKSAMISKRMKGNITSFFWKYLMLHKENFSWSSKTTGGEKFKGPAMLHLLVSTLNSITGVGITEFKN